MRRGEWAAEAVAEEEEELRLECRSIKYAYLELYFNEVLCA